jgi:microsomal dipeptidase-like Zn-dependent dipeptidase
MSWLAPKAALAALVIITVPAPARAAEPWSPAYGLDDACVTLAASNGHITKNSGGYGFSANPAAAERFRLDATALGRYTLRDAAGGYPYQSVLGFVLPGQTYGDRADWTATADGGGHVRFTSTATGQGLGVLLGRVGAGAAVSWTATPATGCTPVNDIGTGVTGTAAPGVDANGRLVGWIDGHAHVTAADAFGGDLHCGDAWAAGGPEVALKGCASHATLGIGALLEAIIAGTDPIDSREDGWPTFGDWPQHDSLLHEQSYFRGIERSWRSGQRVLNTLLVANRVICGLYPTRDTSCDEMEQIRAQADYLRSMQDYVDAQSGGPGRGWFRLAATPEQVRAIAAEGKLAVTIGVESSELFGCNVSCTTAAVDAGLDELAAMGVSGLYPVHKFDNAFGGTRFDSGATGVAINIGNVITTGHWWTAESCTGPSDNEQPLVSDELAELLRLGELGLPAGTILPVYPSGPICNTRGLTPLGGYLIARMMDRGMIIHIDHMGVRTATAVLDLAEAADYPGVVSVHSWSDPAIIDRILELGGFAAGYAHAATDAGDGETPFLDEWRANTAGHTISGYGVGSDVNGLGPQAPPQLSPPAGPQTYPFTAPNGTTVDRQVFGTRTFDLNTDGVAQYGLYADWVTDLIRQAGPDGARLEDQLMNGAEAYTAMWEAARA